MGWVVVKCFAWKNYYIFRGVVFRFNSIFTARVASRVISAVHIRISRLKRTKCGNKNIFGILGNRARHHCTNVQVPVPILLHIWAVPKRSPTLPCVCPYVDSVDNSPNMWIITYVQVPKCSLYPHIGDNSKWMRIFLKNHTNLCVYRECQSFTKVRQAEICW